jgi:hypothetical protein
MTWPRLTDDLAGPRHPYQCQRCGTSDPGKLLDRWQECDDRDKREPRVVVLCAGCSKAVVDPHPRLYHRMHRNDPMPGSMELCVGCQWRRGVSCSHFDLKANGGPGLAITQCKPVDAFWCGGKYSGFARTWPEPPSACAGRLGLQLSTGQVVRAPDQAELPL